MRGFLKVTLVLVAIALVTGSMLFYAKTRLDPPRPVAETHVHADHVRKSIESIAQAYGPDKLRAKLFACRHLIGFLDDNGLLSTEESDTLKYQMLDKYIPAFSDWCLRCFQAPTWYSDDLRQMRRDIKSIRNIRRSDKSRIAPEGSPQSERLDTIAAVLNRYDAARGMVSKGGDMKFESLNDSEKRINRAKAYRHDFYLKNNVSLVNSLDSVPYWLEKAHYTQLVKWVDNMANCTYMEEDEYDEQHNRVLARIDNYEENAYAVYGHSHNVRSLRTQMERFRDDYIAKKSSFSISIGGVDFRF